MKSRLANPWVWVVAAALGALAWWGWPQVRAWRAHQAGSEALTGYRVADARQHLETALETWPESVELRLLAARAARLAGDFSGAQRHLDAGRQADTENTAAPAIAFEWALLRAAMGDLVTVEEALQSRLVKEPERGPEIWCALAEGYRRMSRVREAVTCLDLWLEQEPDSAQAHEQFADVHRQIGALRRARDHYARAVELDPQRVQARGHLVRCLLQLGGEREALGHLDELRRIQPEAIEWNVYLARCRRLLGDVDEGQRLLEAVLKRDPSNGLALKERGRAALTAERAAEAETWLRGAAAALPFDYETQFALFTALQLQGKTQAAKAQQAVAQQLRDRQERIAKIETRDMSARPHDLDLHCELGTLLVSVGKRESGLRWLQAVLRVDPNHAAARAAVAELEATSGAKE